MKRLLLTILGLVMMGASIYGYARYAESVRSAGTTVEAIMPVRMIMSGETVEASMLRRVEIPAEALDADALQEEEEIIGKTALMPIGPNEQIAAWKVAERKLTPRAGERYISFPTDEVTNVGNMLRRGDRVDVWVEFDQPTRIGEKWKGAVKVIEGLEVASVRATEGTEVTDEASVGFQPRSEGRSGAAGSPGINTFIMSEEVYEAYALAKLLGTVKLALPDLSLQGGETRVSAEFQAFREEMAEEAVGE